MHTVTSIRTPTKTAGVYETGRGYPARGQKTVRVCCKGDDASQNKSLSAVKADFKV